MSKENEATPAENNGGTPPATPAATPSSTPEMVSLTKEEADQLRRDAARAATNQSKADRYDRMTSKKGHFNTPTPATPPTPEEVDARNRAEDEKASRGLMGIAADPAFRAVLDGDPTLRNLLLTDPLAALRMLAPDALDAEDGIALVKDALKARVPGTPATPPAPPAPPTTPPTPPAGGVNPDSKELDVEYEAAKKNPNTESAIADMVKIGAKKLGSK